MYQKRQMLKKKTQLVQMFRHSNAFSCHTILVVKIIGPN